MGEESEKAVHRLKTRIKEQIYVISTGCFISR